MYSNVMTNNNTTLQLYETNTHKNITSFLCIVML